jgi:hypothetical protein
MSEKIRQFIDQLSAGQNAEAKDTLENELAARSFGALDGYKKEIAQGIFGGNQETEEEELLTQEEFDDLSEEEQEMYLEYVEQLDELSNTTLKSYLKKKGSPGKAAANPKPGQTPDDAYTKTDINRKKARKRLQMRQGTAGNPGRLWYIKPPKSYGEKS